jgi:hypothetical protein
MLYLQELNAAYGCRLYEPVRNDDTSSVFHRNRATDTCERDPSTAQPTTEASTSGAETRPQAASEHQTFDVPTQLPDMPPCLPPDLRFEVVLGCEVMYELLHARWVAAALAARLALGGKALVCGAVRDRNVFAAFEGYLSMRGLCYVRRSISAAQGYPGLGTDEDVYEDGYRLYYVQHAQAPCTSWHADLQTEKFVCQ